MPTATAYLLSLPRNTRIFIDFGSGWIDAESSGIVRKVCYDRVKKSNGRTKKRPRWCTYIFSEDSISKLLNSETCRVMIVKVFAYRTSIAVYTCREFLNILATINES